MFNIKYFTFHQSQMGRRFESNKCILTIPFHCDDMRIKKERTKKYGEGCQAVHLISGYDGLHTCLCKIDDMPHGNAVCRRSPLLSKNCSFECFFFVHIVRLMDKTRSCGERQTKSKDNRNAFPSHKYKFLLKISIH